VLIGSTDLAVITAKTGASPDQYFTYYDQRHTTGTDIKQSQDAIGLTTIDIDTKARDLWQGVMRLRQLAVNQTVEILIPKEVAETRPGKVQWNIDDIIDLVQTNQDKVKSDIHLRSAIDKMDDVVRQTLLDQIADTKSVAEKARLRQIFAGVFLTKTMEDPFVKFGQCEKLLKTEDILKEHAKVRAERYEQYMKLASLSISPTAYNVVNDALDFIVDKSLPQCLEYYKHVSRVDEEQTVEAQKTVDTLKESLPEKLTETQVHGYEGQTPKLMTSWGMSFPKKIEPDPAGSLKKSYPVGIYHLNTMLANVPMDLQWGFSDNLYVSENYMETIEKQYNKMDNYIKPLHFFLVIKEPGTDKLKTLLITQEEAIDFRKYISLHKDELIKEEYEAWIRTPHNDQFAGTSPTVNNPSYPKTLEEIQFFNGDLDMLSQNKSFEWLFTRPNEKIKFLENVILKNHPEKKKFLSKFKKDFDLVIRKEIEKSQVDMNSLFLAVKNNDFKVLEHELHLLNQVSNPVIRSVVINYFSSEHGLSLMNYAISIGNLRMVERLLKESSVEDYPNSEDSALRLAIQYYHPEIYRRILLDSRMLPQKLTTYNLANQRAWGKLLNEVLATNNNEIIMPFIDQMKNNCNPRAVEILIKEKMEFVKTLPLSQAIEIMKHLEKLSDNPLIAWRVYLKNIAQSGDIEKAWKCLLELIENTSNAQLKYYLKGRLWDDDAHPSLLNDIWNHPQGKQLAMRLLKDVIFTIPSSDLKSWSRYLSVSDVDSFDCVIETIMKNLDKEQTKALLSESSVKKLFSDLLDSVDPQYNAYGNSQAAEDKKHNFFEFLKIYPLANSISEWNVLLNRLDKKT